MIYSSSALFRLRRSNGHLHNSVTVRMISSCRFDIHGHRQDHVQILTKGILSTMRLYNLTPVSFLCQQFEVANLWFNLLTLLLSNVTSLFNKFDEFVTIVISVKVAVVSFTKGWQIVRETYYTEDIWFFHSLHISGHGGGVVLFCHMCLRYRSQARSLSVIYNTLPSPQSPIYSVKVLFDWASIAT